MRGCVECLREVIDLMSLRPIADGELNSEIDGNPDKQDCEGYGDQVEGAHRKGGEGGGCKQADHQGQQDRKCHAHRP